MPFALNLSYFSIYPGACELHMGVKTPGTPTYDRYCVSFFFGGEKFCFGRGSWTRVLRKESRSSERVLDTWCIMWHAHKYVLAGGRKRERLAGVRLLYGLLQWEVIAPLGLARSEVGDDGSHVSLLLSFLGPAQFGNCVRGNGPSQSVSPPQSLRYHIVQRVEERIGFCFFASKSRSINCHHENLSDNHRAKAQRSSKCPVSSFAVPLAKQ